VQVFNTLANVGNAKYECVSKLSHGEASKIHKIEENLKFAKQHWSGV
jgi:cellobiose-specific phosphotransferase system component IIA